MCYRCDLVVTVWYLATVGIFYCTEGSINGTKDEIVLRAKPVFIN